MLPKHSVSAGILRHGGIMKQQKFVQINNNNNSKPFPTYVVAIEEVENYYECFKYDSYT